MTHDSTQGFGPAAATANVPDDPTGLRLLEELGRGGMGVVYRAWDTVLDREVAVKVLQDRFPLDSGAARRFHDEARITGQLQHPGIPAIHQAGTLPNGRPFLAMKLIKGRTLDRLLQERDPAGGDRGELLAIFEQTCQAVAYAHAHRVIHRDLKPGNIMVGAFGEVQVMDWGLAKVLSDEPTAPTESPPTQQTMPETQIRSARSGDISETEAGSMIGTPAFMPPEQAGGELRKVSERADVFGLGGLLALILTGQPPYTGDSAEAIRLMAIRGQLSDCLARLDACEAEPALVTLCRQCLAFEPGQRPADAGVMAAAVASLRAAAEERARHAEREHAAAEARAQEQRRKRRWQLAAAAVVAVALLAGVAGLSAFARAQAQANEELAQANARERQAKVTAQAREAETRAVLQFVENKVFAATRPKGRTGGLGREVTLREALDAALPFVDDGFRKKPLIEARLRYTLGTSYQFLGENQIAADQFEAALALYTAKLGREHRDTLRCMHQLAHNWAALGRNTDALTLAEQTLELQQTQLGPHDADTLQTIQLLARVYVNLGRKADALKLREQTLALQKEHLGVSAPDTIRTMTNLAGSYIDAGRYDDAIRLGEEALVLARSGLDAHHPDTLRCMHSLAQSYAAAGRQAEALKLREEALALQKEVLGPDHPDTLKTSHNLVLSYHMLKRYAEAIKLGEETLALRKAKLGPTHPDTLRSMHNLANSYSAVGRHHEALKLLQETLPLRQRQLGPRHPDTLRTMGHVASGYGALGRHGEALALHKETLALQSSALGPDHLDTLGGMQAVAGDLVKLGRHAEAVPILDECLPRAVGRAGFERVTAGVVDLRLKCLAKARDVAACRQAAENWEKLGRTDADSLFIAACLRAFTAKTIAEVDRSPAAEKQAHAEAERAVVWIKQAAAAGFKNGPLLAKTKGLTVLRECPDYAKLLAAVENTPPARDRPAAEPASP